MIVEAGWPAWTVISSPGANVGQLITAHGATSERVSDLVKGSHSYRQMKFDFLITGLEVLGSQHFSQCWMAFTQIIRLL